jgi:NADPH:quinone reductase-like Zn-dependent oxidoreductase
MGEVYKARDTRLDRQTQEDSWAVLKPDGILVATAIPPSPDRAKAAGVRGTFIFTQPSGDVLAQIAEVVDSGKVRPIIGGEFALNDAFKAHELSESGRARGKIVLYVGQP